MRPSRPYPAQLQTERMMFTSTIIYNRVYELLSLSCDNKNSSNGGRTSRPKKRLSISSVEKNSHTVSNGFFFFIITTVASSVTSLDPISCAAKLFLCLIFYLPSRRRRPSRSHTTPPANVPVADAPPSVFLSLARPICPSRSVRDTIFTFRALCTYIETLGRQILLLNLTINKYKY